MTWPRLNLETPEAADVPEPVTLDAVKEHLRQTIDLDDDYIFNLIAKARAHAEDTTKRALVARTATMILPYLPHVIRLPYGKAQSVTSIVYFDTAGVAQTLNGGASPAEFQEDLTDDEEPLLKPLRNTVWPSTDTESIAPVTITWEAGYGDPEDVPWPIRHAIALQVAEWYEARSNLEAPERDGALFSRALLPYALP